MAFEAWIIFAVFWAIFVTTPGPNAVNCIQQGMSVGFKQAMWCVAAILTQATAFLILSAFGITALILASPTAFLALQLIGAAFLIILGVRGWLLAKKPVSVAPRAGRSLYFQALGIATINAKSVAGYLAAFSQFVQPDIPDMGADVGDYADGTDPDCPQLYRIYRDRCGTWEVGARGRFEYMVSTHDGTVLYYLWHAFGRGHVTCKIIS